MKFFFDSVACMPICGSRVKSLELPDEEGDDGEGLAAQDKKTQSLRQRCKSTLHMAACILGRDQTQTKCRIIYAVGFALWTAQQGSERLEVPC